MIADVTWFFHWGPHDASGLTWTELSQWHAQAQRIAKIQAGQ